MVTLLWCGHLILFLCTYKFSSPKFQFVSPINFPFLFWSTMEDKGQDRNNNNRSSINHGTEGERNEPVRSRWTPKPEQILILESIFNSGMVNPPKDETVRIRKLLEKFGSVGDANVFYWFQNRRSRSRRRQRQIQASLNISSTGEQSQSLSQSQTRTGGGGGGGLLRYETSFSPVPNNFSNASSSDNSGSGLMMTVQNDCSVNNNNDFYTFPSPIGGGHHHHHQPEFDQNSPATTTAVFSCCPSDINDSHFPSGNFLIWMELNCESLDDELN